MKRVVVLALIIVHIFSVMSFAAKPADKAEPVLNFDQDGDRIFENLAREMKSGQNSDRYHVIVLFDQETSIPGLKRQLGEFGVKFMYKQIKGFAGELTKGQITALSRMPSVKQIQLDAEMTAFMETAKTSFGINHLSKDFGVDGDRDGNPTSYSKSDVVVAVIDTGIDGAHADLDGGKILYFKDYINNRTAAYDDQGHGSHCAAIIAGTGEGNADFAGVAPGAALIGLKVLNSSGAGSTSDVDAAIEWCIENKATYGIDIISMSLGASGSSNGTDSTSLLLQQAWDAGIVPVVAAGNEGPKQKTIGSPAAAEYAITVGALADMGHGGFFQAHFSSRGPTADNRIKPDISAPGWYIMSVKANTTNAYTEMSGTSLAAPFCAGTVALMLDANPAMTPDQVKDILLNTAEDWGPVGKDNDYGAGLMKSYDAVKAAGGFSGTGPVLPMHFYVADSIAAQGKTDIWSLNVTSLEPIAATIIMPDYYESGWWLFVTPRPDFDVYVYDPNGTQVAKADTSRRQEEVRFKPTITGTYKIHITAYTDSGRYFMDVSAGANDLFLNQNQ